MFFLLRAAFWLTIVLVLLPTGTPKTAAPASQLGAVDAVAAAGAAVSDVSGFCDRQADACVIGAQAATVIGQRAQAGAKMVYDFINERIVTGSTAVADSDAPLGLRGTLKPDDLAPTWRGPATRPPAEAQPRRDGKSPA